MLDILLLDLNGVRECMYTYRINKTTVVNERGDFPNEIVIWNIGELQRLHRTLR